MKKLAQYILITAFFLYCGAYGFHWMVEPKLAVQAPANIECSNSDPRLEDAKRKFEALAQVDYEDYLKLKTDAEKYKKADEILGKIMAVFIADLGIHFKEKASVSPTPSIATSAPVLPVKTQVPPLPTPIFLRFRDVFREI